MPQFFTVCKVRSYEASNILLKRGCFERLNFMKSFQFQLKKQKTAQSLRGFHAVFIFKVFFISTKENPSSSYSLLLLCLQFWHPDRG